MPAAVTAPAPIILTAALGAADFAWADGLRRAHFPPERNHVPAHITLFHHLPPSLEGALLDHMGRLCAGPAPSAMLGAVLHLGHGVAFRVDSPDLLEIRQQFKCNFRCSLTPQDNAPPRLHITIQNKVSDAVSHALHAALAADFRPHSLTIAGLSAWRYRGGPWDLIRTTRFRG